MYKIHEELVRLSKVFEWVIEATHLIYDNKWKWEMKRRMFAISNNCFWSSERIILMMSTHLPVFRVKITHLRSPLLQNITLFLTKLWNTIYYDVYISGLLLNWTVEFWTKFIICRYFNNATELFFFYLSFEFSINFFRMFFIFGDYEATVIPCLLSHL